MILENDDPKTVGFKPVKHRFFNLIENGIDYIELLEVKEPPEGKLPFIIVSYVAGRCLFCELTSIDKADPLFTKLKNAKGQYGMDTILTREKIPYQVIDSNLIKPWCYGNQNYPSGYFGKEKQFTTPEQYDSTPEGGILPGVEHLLIAPDRTITIDTPIGFYKGMTLWESGNAFEYGSMLAVSSSHAGWENSSALNTWLIFIGSSKKKTVSLTFSQYRQLDREVTLIVSFKRNSKTNLGLEMSAVVNGEDHSKITCYSAEIGSLPKSLYCEKGLENPFWEILKYFMIK